MRKQKDDVGCGGARNRSSGCHAERKTGIGSLRGGGGGGGAVVHLNPHHVCPGLAPGQKLPKHHSKRVEISCHVVDELSSPHLRR